MARARQFTKELEALATVLDALNGLDEDAQRFVLRTAIERLGVTGIGGALRKSENGGGSGGDGDNDDEGDGQGERAEEKKRSKGAPSATDFLDAKKPLTEVQRVAVLAFYLKHHGNLAHVRTIDISKANTDAAGDPFSNPTRALDDATKAKFLAPVARGKKQITPLGTRVVNALPNQEAVKTVLSDPHTRRLRRRGRGKRAAKGRAS